MFGKTETIKKLFESLNMSNSAGGHDCKIMFFISFCLICSLPFLLMSKPNTVYLCYCKNVSLLNVSVSKKSRR